MNSWINEYSKEMLRWDTVHRIVGRLSPEELVVQSREALSSAECLAGSLNSFLFVDVGAGQGLLGIPALYMFPEIRVLFVEPDPKKTAFLRNYLYVLHPELGARSRIECCRLEDVSRETCHWASSVGLEPVLFARAFSGKSSLEQAVEDSPFAGKKIFIFHAEGGRHFFKNPC